MTRSSVTLDCCIFSLAGVCQAAFCIKVSKHGLGAEQAHAGAAIVLCMQAMAIAAPEQLQIAFRQPVEKLLSGNQAEDKSRTCAALEMLFGLIASGNIFGPQGETAKLVGFLPGVHVWPLCCCSVVLASNEHVVLGCIKCVP